MNVAVAASRPRCLVVAIGLTAALWGAAAVLAGTLTARQPATPDAALVRVCLAALLVAVGWAWLQGVAGVADAWRGATHPAPGQPPRHAIRGLALAACGVAIAGALAAPAGAATDGPRPDPLSGLPLPDRAEGPAHPGHAARPGSVVVSPGDTLWALAEDELPRDAGDGQITSGWHRIYRDNRAVIGDDPDLIHPGQVLRLGKEHP